MPKPLIRCALPTCGLTIPTEGPRVVVEHHSIGKSSRQYIKGTHIQRLAYFHESCYDVLVEAMLKVREIIPDDNDDSQMHAHRSSHWLPMRKHSPGWTRDPSNMGL